MATTPTYDTEENDGYLYEGSSGVTGVVSNDNTISSNSNSNTTTTAADSNSTTAINTADSSSNCNKTTTNTTTTAITTATHLHHPHKLNRINTIADLVESWKMKGCTELFMRYLRIKYNPSQLHAIHTAVEQEGFTLVQGPPGTGKTSTILGILNAIHIREYNRYYKLALEVILGPEGQKCRLQSYEHPWLSLITQLTSIKPRLLVVAPSNTAVDNIILRIMKDGFIDGNGGKYYPNILRFGGSYNNNYNNTSNSSGSSNSNSNRGINASIKSVSLDELIRKEINTSTNTTTTNININNNHERLEYIQKLNKEITIMITELAYLQSLLVNLNKAYLLLPYLPENYELRVDFNNAQPYWVDHLLKTTSTTPPNGKILEIRGRNSLYNSIESLPEYIRYSHKLTQLIGNLDILSIKRKQIYNITDTTSSNNNMYESTENLVINNAHILFTTLNSAGHPSLESTEFCVTVVDEAAQVKYYSNNMELFNYVFYFAYIFMFLIIYFKFVYICIYSIIV